MSYDFKADEVIEAVRGTGGIISTIAKKLGCAWNTAKKYIDEHPTVKLAYDAECEGILDLAEVKLIGAINEGDMAAIKFYLTTKGKRRGYTERIEQQTFNFDMSQLTNTQLQRIADGEDPLAVISSAGHS